MRKSIFMTGKPMGLVHVLRNRQEMEKKSEHMQLKTARQMTRRSREWTTKMMKMLSGAMRRYGK